MLLFLEVVEQREVKSMSLPRRAPVGWKPKALPYSLWRRHGVEQLLLSADPSFQLSKFLQIGVCVIQGVHRLSLSFQKFYKRLVFKIFLFGLFYSARKSFWFFSLLSGTF